ncbi:DeoR/GlpR family DNA-binding transcription regulator [Rhizobium sp. BR 314]|uniref:DeoR/GlpR family DNA-binding transcription regulator n=1 Tax=Rhizobium sp. BR 314 TaxID=3040013 RepID=UPI0039BFE2E3
MTRRAVPSGENPDDATDTIHRPNRQSAILDAVRKHGAASVAELAREFGVTHQTIRRDLKRLNESGLLQKGFGGAFASPGAPHHVYGDRQNLLVSVKRGLVQALEPFIQSNSTIFVGPGTTFDSLHEILARHPDVFVATPNLEVAYRCALNTDATVYVYGGYVRTKDTTVLTVPDEGRNRFKFDIAVLGASAIDEDGAVLESDPLEVDLVRSVLRHSRQVILVAHGEKFGMRAPHRVTSLDSVNVLITNGNALSKLKSSTLISHLQAVVVD